MRALRRQQVPPWSAHRALRPHHVLRPHRALQRSCPTEFLRSNLRARSGDLRDIEGPCRRSARCCSRWSSRWLRAVSRGPRWGTADNSPVSERGAPSTILCVDFSHRLDFGDRSSSARRGGSARRSPLSSRAHVRRAHRCPLDARARGARRSVRWRLVRSRRTRALARREGDARAHSSTAPDHAPCPASEAPRARAPSAARCVSAQRISR